MVSLPAVVCICILSPQPNTSSWLAGSIIIIMIIITLKDTIWDFYSFLNVPWTVLNTCAKVARVSSYANHVQHIERLSHAPCHVAKGIMGSSAIKFERVEIAFILAVFYWLEPLTDEGGEETGVPGENLSWQASENATYLSLKIQTPTETQTCTLALVAG